ncbi:restriction endonuclease subunit S [Marinomonas primoryensis]|nr:restriction endonuclease subunit S [Marinomonas primoryensis]
MTKHNHINYLITEHIDIWSSVIKRKSSAGRGSSKKIELYGIKKLRELILELAVRGKLVPQDPNDEPASVLLERIAQEKAQLVKEGKIKKPKKLPDITEDEKPFELPDGWEWSRLSDLAQIGPRNTDVDDDVTVSFVPMPLILTSYKGSHGSEIRKWKDIKKGYTHFIDGDIALAKITPCFENSKAAIFTDLENGIGAGTTELHVARPLPNTLDPLFILLYLKAPMFLKVGESKMTGSAGQKRVPSDFFANNPLPFAPIEEQHRIVTKVDELMVLCDELEAQTESSLDAHQTLVTVLLDTLVNSQNAEELAENWTRISGHFDTLFTTEQSIDQLKQTILQLAVMGRLVEQNPNDEPASVLLERIAAEKADLIKQGKIKKQKPLPLISEDEKSFELPERWRVSSVDSCFYVSGGIQKTPKRAPVSNHYPYLAVANVQRGNIDINDLKRFEVTGEELDQYRLESFDLLVVEGNGSENEIGRCAIWKGEIENCLHQNHLIKCRPAIHKLSDWVLMVLNSPLGISEMKRLAVTSSGLYNLSVGKVRTILLPIPPLEEQHRIVAKVDELMAICDQLKVSLSEEQTTQLNLADALVEQAL